MTLSLITYLIAEDDIKSLSGCYDPAVCESYDEGEIRPDSSVGRAFTQYAEVRGSIPRSVIFFCSALLSYYLFGRMSEVRLFHPSRRSSIRIRQIFGQKYRIIMKYPFPTIFYCDEEFTLFSLTILSDHLVDTHLLSRNMPMPLSLETHSQ